ARGWAGGPRGRRPQERVPRGGGGDARRCWSKAGGAGAAPLGPQRYVGEVGNRGHDANTPSSRSISRRVASTSHLMKMKRSTPAARQAASLAPGLPASTTDRAPAAFSLGASWGTTSG